MTTVIISVLSAVATICIWEGFKRLTDRMIDKDEDADIRHHEGKGK